MVYLKRLLRFSVVMVALVGVLTASCAIIGPQVVHLVSAHRSNHERLDLRPLAERSYIYDTAGNQMGVLINGKNENRVQVSLDKVPQTVIGSVLAAEDENFYHHKGVNIRSIGRAVDANLGSGSVSQGGSTITQQVVKNSLVGNEQDLSRKIREAFLAVELEKQMTKDQILERYLNSVYFGGGAYGVQAASEYYFNKDISQLNWAEGALLASLIRSPSNYDPFKHPKLAIERRHVVFKRLLATKRLTTNEVKFFEGVPLPTTPNVPTPPSDYFVEEVKQQLLDDPSFGLGATPAARNRTVFDGGIRVFTTLNPDYQEKAKQARNGTMETLPTNNGNGTFGITNPKDGSTTFGTEAMASIEPSTGAVRAMVGGPGFDTYQFNLATHLPGRQPGSSMKTFVLATLFENGYIPDDTVSGSRCVIRTKGEPDYAPATEKGGTSTILHQLQESSNCAFVRLGQLVGIDKVIGMAKRLGVRSPLANVRSLPLGTYDITPIDMASAYATFANDGMQNDPYYIERIEDRNHKVLYQHQLKPVRVVESQVARLVNKVLQANVTGGTGTRAQIDNGQPAAGKTGTTNESSDVWFVGYTPQLSTAIWMGAPIGRISLDNAGLGGATGGRYPAATWGRFYSSLFDGQPIQEFVPPDPTRKGKNVGRIPNEVGGSGGSSKSSGRGTGRGGGTTTGGGTTGGGTTTGTAPADTVPPTTPGFGGGNTGAGE
ncbi:transglycosylase domain-containing protein [Aquihabitans sp. McL0605]|uniref:transglycosylase domain-containing protein n=1 Tax=Aquihabitans sp. McL0605 TaxID=3415671 RepID=UPI003CF544F7